MRRCANRELEFRVKVYPKLIEKGRMSGEKTDFEIETIKKNKRLFWLSSTIFYSRATKTILRINKENENAR